MQQKSGPWVHYAREKGLNDPEQDIAVRWASQLMQQETDGSARVKVLMQLSSNTGAGIAAFTKAFGEYLQLAENHTLAAGIRELRKYFEDKKNHTCLKAMAYRLNRTEKMILLKQNEAREAGQEPDAWITELLKAIAETRESAAANK